MIKLPKIDQFILTDDIGYFEIQWLVSLISPEKIQLKEIYPNALTWNSSIIEFKKNPRRFTSGIKYQVIRKW
jgi:hypothetical protein